MIRTQIYLSEEQKAALAALAARKGENVSEVIRKAVERYIAEQRKENDKREQEVERVLRGLSGAWKDNNTDFVALRRSADRKFD